MSKVPTFVRFALFKEGLISSSDGNEVQIIHWRTVPIIGTLAVIVMVKYLEKETGEIKEMSTKVHPKDFT